MWDFEWLLVGFCQVQIGILKGGGWKSFDGVEDGLKGFHTWKSCENP